MKPNQEAEELIREQARLFDVPTHAVIATTVDGAIVYWSAGARLLYGWQDAETLGRNIVEITTTNTTRAEAMAIMDQLRKGKSWSGEFAVSTSSGGAVRARVTNLPVRDAAGELIGIIGVSTRAADTPTL